ncbi:MAG TPA: hypothetical protein VN833_07910 [Candidatus Acidoferrales bacterium]|nr:hypothetical protein [Candidatus Acidoferrales bacterium]
MGWFDKLKLKVRVRKVGKISPAHLNHFTLKGEARKDERFNKARWTGISISTSQLERCIFDDVHSESVNLGGGLTQSTYTACLFQDCDLVFGAIGNARFTRCRFRRCRLSHFFGTQLEMIDCTFPETSIRQAVFHSASSTAQKGSPVRERNGFIGNDLSSADLVDVDFRGGIDLTKQILPSGPDYIYIADTGLAASIAGEWAAEFAPTSPDTKRAKSLQRMLEFYHSHGQKQQLLRLSGHNQLKEQLRSRFLPVHSAAPLL